METENIEIVVAKFRPDDLLAQAESLVVDFAKLSDEYKMPNPQAIKDALRAGIKHIAGLEYYEVEIPVNR